MNLKDNIDIIKVSYLFSSFQSLCQISDADSVEPRTYFKLSKIRSPSLYWFKRKNWISQPQLDIDRIQSSTKTNCTEDFHSKYLRENRINSNTSTLTFPLDQNENSIKKLFDDGNNNKNSTDDTKENSSGLLSSWSTTSGNSYKKLYPSDESGYCNNNSIITKKLISSTTNKGQVRVGPVTDSDDTATVLASCSSSLLQEKQKDNNFIVDIVSGVVNNKNVEKTKNNQR